MDIHDYLTAVASTYSSDSLHSEGHGLLAQAPLHLQDLVPGGLKVKAGGGKGIATLTPWIAILDPDETTSPQRGVYVVYIFTKDLLSVYLTLNQGITVKSNKSGYKTARSLLSAEAATLRSAVPALTPFLSTIDLGDRGKRARGYEAGNIGAKKYSVANLPDSDELQADLWSILRVQQQVLDARRRILVSDPGTLALPGELKLIDAVDPLAGFAPKSDEDYVQYLAGKTLLKSRRHETLVKQYGLHANKLGFVPHTKTVHPRDLVLRSPAGEWLIEAKVVYGGNTTDAVRAVLGQLTMYEHLLYSDPVEKVALFSEPIGALYEGFLEKFQIASIWKSDVGWGGCMRAEIQGLL